MFRKVKSNSLYQDTLQHALATHTATHTAQALVLPIQIQQQQIQNVPENPSRVWPMRRVAVLVRGQLIDIVCMMQLCSRIQSKSLFFVQSKFLFLQSKSLFFVCTCNPSLYSLQSKFRHNPSLYFGTIQVSTICTIQVSICTVQFSIFCLCTCNPNLYFL